MPLYRRMTAQVPAFSPPCDLEQGQGHSHWYQNTDFSHVFHQTKFETNSFIWMQANHKHILNKITLVEFSFLNINHAIKKNIYIYIIYKKRKKNSMWLDKKPR